ncbi:TnsA-like heteromeric transposase endonuclease subunit [Nonomuraea sp. KM90]|uniref:TnsA-like heteromeric transposase endonuclease subunit n=1 Tax=Nonomuraea sp. KM90 TaxID=3457428 RepID=UPI003FCD22B0
MEEIREHTGSSWELSWLGERGAVRRPLGDAVDVGYESVPPVREFVSYRGQRHFPGLYYAATMDAHVGFESWLERDHAMLLDFDPQVVGFASQPFWLWWRDETSRRERSHAPDFFARTADGTALVIDCRPVERRDVRSAESFSVMGRACELAGWAYRLVGELEPTRAANLRWLAGYRHRRHGETGMVPAVVAAFTVPGPLLAQAATVSDPIEVLPVVFHLLWTGQLTTDLSRPLSDRSLISEAGR